MQGWTDWLNDNSGVVTAVAAVAGVAVTAIYAFFTVLLWMATKRQAQITSRIFEATHRPELSVRPYLPLDANKGFVRLDFELMNHGSMTATVTEWNARITRRRYDLTDRW